MRTTRKNCRWDLVKSLIEKLTFRQMLQKASAWKILFDMFDAFVPWSLFPFGCFLFNERDLFDVFNERVRLEDWFISVNFKLKSKTPVVVGNGNVDWFERFSSFDWDDNDPSSQFKLTRSYSSSRFCSAATW